jgi:hypothetical protein
LFSNGPIYIASNLTLDSAGFMEINGPITIARGASLFIAGSKPAEGLGSNNRMASELHFVGAGSRLVGMGLITKLSVEGNVSFSDGASCVYAGVLNVNGGGFNSFLDPLFSLNRARLTTLSSGGFNVGRAQVVNGSEIELFNASYFRFIDTLLVENSKINISDATKIVVENFAVNSTATALVRNASLALSSLARFEIIGRLFLDHSDAVLKNGTILAHFGVEICNNSALRIDGVNATLRLLNDGLTICNNSALIVESGASLDLSDSVVLLTLEDILLYIRSGGTQGGSTVASRSPNIQIDASSRLEIRNGATILGVGTINGVVVNNGGIISYRKGGSSGLFIDTLQQSNTSTIQTGVSINPVTLIPVLSTVLLLRNATLGGNIEFFIDPILDSNLRNSTDFQARLKPGTGGLLLVNVTESDIATIPNVILRSSSGAVLDEQTRCAYAVEKRGRALYLVFDISRECDGAGSPGAPLSAAAVEAAGVAIAAIVVPIVLIVVVGGIILAFVLTPTLRRKVFGWEAAQVELQTRKQALRAAENKPSDYNP